MFIIKKDKRGKTVHESSIEGEKIKLFSDHISPHGFIFGGRILEVLDSFAEKVATIHSEAICKKITIDFVRVFEVAKKEDIFFCFASITRAWQYSMEIGIKVVAEDFRTLEKKHILSAYFTFDALDEKGNFVEIPSLICLDRIQRRRYMEAEKRRIIRIKKKFS